MVKDIDLLVLVMFPTQGIYIDVGCQRWWRLQPHVRFKITAILEGNWLQEELFFLNWNLILSFVLRKYGLSLFFYGGMQFAGAMSLLPEPFIISPNERTLSWIGSIEDLLAFWLDPSLRQLFAL